MSNVKIPNQTNLIVKQARSRTTHKKVEGPDFGSVFRLRTNLELQQDPAFTIVTAPFD